MDGATVDTLQEIGLTEYQSRAYVAAVDLGSARLSALADESDVPQQRIYDVVDDLEALGLIEVHEGKRGKEAVAVPPDVGLAELKQQHVDRFETNVDAAIDGLNRVFDEVNTSMGFVTVVTHESSARRHARDAIESAEWWLFLSVPVDWYREFEDAIRAAVERDVTVRLLVHSEGGAGVHDISYPGGMLVRHRPSADLVVAADRGYGVFRGVAAPAVARPSLVTRDESLVDTFQRYCEQFWTGSEWVQTGPTYPRRYLSPWRAIDDHAEELAAGAPFEARVEGHATATGRMDSWAGRIVEAELETADDADCSVVIPEVARLVLETEEGRVSVGGWDATLEDVAAHGIEIRPTEGAPGDDRDTDDEE